MNASDGYMLTLNGLLRIILGVSFSFTKTFDLDELLIQSHGQKKFSEVSGYLGNN